MPYWVWGGLAERCLKHIDGTHSHLGKQMKGLSLFHTCLSESELQPSAAKMSMQHEDTAPSIFFLAAEAIYSIQKWSFTYV